MKWSVGNAPDEFQQLSREQRQLAISIANGVYQRGVRKGRDDPDEAIRVAMAKVKENYMEPNERLFDEDLTFSVLLSEGESVAGEDGSVRVPATLLKSGWSKNGRYYSPELVESMAPRYEGAGSFGGHLKKPTPVDYVAVHRGVRCERIAEGAKLTSTYHIFDEKLARVATHAPHLIQLSIRDKGRVRRGEAEGREGWIVEELTGDRPTCDAVVTAAARGSIGAVLEAFQDEEEPMEIKSVHDLKEAFPDLVKAIAEEAVAVAETQGKQAELAESLKETTSELTKAVKERDEARTRVQILESHAVLDEKLATAKLPERLDKRVRKQFEGVVVEEAAVEEAIADMKALLAEVSEEANVSDVEEEPEDVQDDGNGTIDLLRKVGLLRGDE